MTQGPYSRVYHSIVDDPQFTDVFDDDAACSAWLRLLLIADGTFPSPAPIPQGTKKAALQRLVEAELVELLPGHRYRIRGMVAERALRSASGRNAAALRWHGPGNAPRDADPMPSKDETRKDKQGGANAPEQPARPDPLTEEQRSTLLQENLRLMNDPKVPGPVRRAAERTVAVLRNERKSA